MKKHIWLVCCLAISMLLLSSCGSTNQGDLADWKPTKYEIINNLEDVIITVTEGTISSTGLTVILENNSDKQCVYGEDFLLEKKMDGNWYQVPVVIDGDYGFNAIGYDLAPGDVQEWTVDWESFYGEIDIGEYRIVKDILDFRSGGDYDTYHLTAEFTVE